MSVIDRYLENNALYAQDFRGPLPLPPSSHVAVVACMDARLDVYRILGLKPGEAHVIRNAGGIIDDAAIRSLAISQRLLGTREIILIHHTDCGMLSFTDDQLRQKLREDLGVQADLAFLPFSDLEQSVRDDVAMIRSSALLLKDARVRGYIYDVKTGRLREVE